MNDQQEIDFSHQLAQALNSDFFLEMPLSKRNAFIRRASLCRSEDELTSADKKLFHDALNGEKSSYSFEDIVRSSAAQSLKKKRDQMLIHAYNQLAEQKNASTYNNN